MKLYIKRDKTVEDSLFIIFDELGKEKYYVKCSKNNIILSDLEGSGLLKIKQLPLPKISAYSLTTKEHNIKFFMNAVKNHCYYYGTAWHIRGDVFSKSFDIIDADNSLVAAHEKSFCDGKSCYLLDINNKYSELFCIGTAVCVDLYAKVDNLCVQTV